MKYYKVYAKNVNVPKGKAITEVTQSQAESLVCDAVDDMIDCGIIEIDDSGKYIEYIYDIAIAKFIKNGQFDCGDYRIVISEEAPNRPNICSYTLF